eukprot:4254105-Alexandrium_andersonii.AAC.1
MCIRDSAPSLAWTCARKPTLAPVPAPTPAPALALAASPSLASARAQVHAPLARACALAPLHPRLRPI